MSGAPPGVHLPDNPKVLVAIITGGRPEVKQRPSIRQARLLAESGFGDVVNVMREDWADVYEDDGFGKVVYTQSFDDGYSRKHWRHPRKLWEPGGFHGAFTGREWAMRYAAENGYDAVLQMDDNVRKTGLLKSTGEWGSAAAIPETADLLLRYLASTNASLLGFQLDSVPLSDTEREIRVGYPYSLFLEKVTATRPPYWGPFEDDVMHALDYARSPSPWQTSALMPALKYAKESGSSTGMRSHYNAERGLGLVKHYPENAVLREGPRTSSPNHKDPSDRGVRHYLTTKGFTPVHVIDPDKFEDARKAHAVLMAKTLALRSESRREKWERRSQGLR